MAPVARARVIPMGKRASSDPEKMRLAREAARRTSIAPCSTPADRLRGRRFGLRSSLKRERIDLRDDSIIGNGCAERLLFVI